jgi:hypothetical protein
MMTDNFEANERLEDKLLALGKRIDSPSIADLQHADQQSLPEWCGADTRITSDFVSEPKDWVDEHELLARTRHAKPLTWLFLELRDAFNPWLDYTNKYGFYGSLARSALQHLAVNQPESDDARPLLRAVLCAAFGHLEALRSQGVIPANAIIVLHERDSEGRQKRTDLQAGEECS